MKLDLLDSIFYYSVLWLSKILRRLPARFTSFLGRCFGLMIYFFSKRRHVAYADLKFAFGGSPREIKRIIRKHYQHLGQSAVEFMRIPDFNESFVKDEILIDHVERFYEISNKGQGALLLTAHYGNWELIQIVAGLLGYPIHVLMQDQKKSKLNALLNDSRKSRGSAVVSKGINMREMIKALREGSLVGVLGDQSAGKKEGIIVRFFGRKTTIPTGAFELATRMNVPILPAFIARMKSGKHQIFVKEPMIFKTASKDSEDYREVVEKYVSILEDLIRQHPEQWLWAKKRWKYSWTKKIVVLRDGKPGHEKQSAAVLKAFQNVESQYGRGGMEYPVEMIDVKYRSNFHRSLFFVIAIFLYPLAQGRLSYLKFFLNRECFERIKIATADFVISTGSSLVPINLFLARENRGKSAVVMKPPFPYNYFKYDLSLVPIHDQGRVPAESIRTMLTPSDNFLNEASLDELDLSKELSNPAQVKIGLFLGGKTGDYSLDVVAVEKMMRILQRISAHSGDFVLTTSRRTSTTVSKFIKRYLPQFPACQRAIIATEDTRSGIVEEIMRICSVLVVTEDSLSMISEAVCSGKEVYVLRVDQLKKLPMKHQSFTASLEARGAVVIVEPESFEYKMLENKRYFAEELVVEEQRKLEERVRQIL